MSYKSTVKTESNHAEPTDHRCPANGCPNAASTNLGGGWACYYHANSQREDWPAVTQWIIDTMSAIKGARA
jgi:uncharacterized protein (UPF0548 family)